MRKIYAVILAAGESTRFPGHKLKKDLNGLTILEHVMTNLKNSGCSGQIVVLGRTTIGEKDKVEALGFDYIYNEKSELGMGFSLACGTKKIKELFNPEEEFGILFTPGDMPFISKNVFKTMVKEFADSETSILIPVFNNRRGHPVIMSSKFYSDIIGLNKDKGARDIIRENSSVIDMIEFDTDDIHIDIDTHEEFDKFHGRIKNNE